MLKVQLLSYPLNIDQVDHLILFMIFHNIDSIQELLNHPENELKQLEGWDGKIESSTHIIRENHQS